jgi:hypothetical protein
MKFIALFAASTPFIALPAFADEHSQFTGAKSGVVAGFADVHVTQLGSKAIQKPASPMALRSAMISA